MPEIPATISVQAQSVRNLRISQIKGTNILDHEIHLYEDSGPPPGGAGTPGTFPILAGAEWTRGVNVKGYERIQFFFDMTPGGDQVGPTQEVFMDVQFGFSQSSVDDNDWYDRMSSFNILFGDTVALTLATPLERQFTILEAAVRTQFNFSLECVGHYMRFRVWAATGGGGSDDSRLFSLKAMRDF